MEPLCYKTAVRSPFAWYREFVPCEALRADVYAFFSFVPGPALSSASRPVLREVAFRETIVCAPQFADGQVSIRFEVGQACDVEGRWRADSNARGETVVGPMSGVGRTARLDFSETVGAYFRPGRASRFFDIPLSHLADTAVAVGDIWGARGSPLSSRLADLNEAARIDCVESFLLARLRHRQQRTHSLDVEGLAESVLRRAGRVTVDGMARAAGVSRQHLSREFRERIGVGPKLYSRLARFQSLLAHASARAAIDWARVALDMGFADQSHMIAECRQFSGLTPQSLADRDWFHPFIERAKSRYDARRDDHRGIRDKDEGPAGGKGEAPN
jgi:AraC-like DNA-binding protein